MKKIMVMLVMLLVVSCGNPSGSDNNDNGNKVTDVTIMDCEVNLNEPENLTQIIAYAVDTDNKEYEWEWERPYYTIWTATVITDSNDIMAIFKESVIEPEPKDIIIEVGLGKPDGFDFLNSETECEVNYLTARL